MKLFRYELSYFDEPQGVGFIQGLKDMKLNNKKIDRLIQILDNELDIPNYCGFEKKKGKYIASFFTETGFEKFQEIINKIITEIDRKDNGFGVIKKTIVINETEHVIYQDEYQILLYLDI